MPCSSPSCLFSSFSCLTLPPFPPGKYQNRFYSNKAKNRNARKLSPKGQGKTMLCPGEQSKKVCLGDTAGQPPSGRWAEGSWLHFPGTERVPESASLLPSGPPFPPTPWRTNTLWPYCGGAGRGLEVTRKRLEQRHIASNLF